MEETAIIQMEDKATQISRDASAIVVSDQKSLDAAGAFRTQVIDPLMKEIIDTFKPMKQKADAAKQEILDQEKKHLGPVAEAKRIVTSKIAAYYEKKELEEAAERRRQEAINQAKAEQERKDRIALEKSLGATAKEIKEIKAEPIYVPPAVVESNVVKPSGVRIPKVWMVEIPDKVAFIKHVAAHLDLAYLLDVNIGFIKSIAVSQKADPGFPGIKCEQKIGGASR